MGNHFSISSNKHSSAGGGSDAGCATSSASEELLVPLLGGRIVTANMKSFTFSDLKKATGNFSPKNMLWEGSLVKVFKGWLNDVTYTPSKIGTGISVTVKKYDQDIVANLSEWQEPSKFLGNFSHPNLVKLIGYCKEDRGFLLVYEYMQRGTLADHLFRKDGEPLLWSTRIRILTGAAQGLAFLHAMKQDAIYIGLISSYILLDLDYNPRLSDFELAKLVLGKGDYRPGKLAKLVVDFKVAVNISCMAVEFIQTGHATINTDIYSFGVVLLEAITGLPAFDSNRPRSHINSVVWALPMLHDQRRLRKMIDPRLENHYPFEGAKKVAKVILQCLDPEPKKRPSMDNIVAELKDIGSLTS